MLFKKHLSKEQGLSDLLNYAHLIDDGVILNKDGAFLMTFKFRGPDIHSATPAECDALTANFNRMVTFLEDGWMLHIDDLRIPSLTYPEVGAFPDSVSLLIDEERRQQYEQAGSHFENLQFLTFVWKFPLPIVRTTRHWFVDGLSKDEEGQHLNQLLTQFYEVVERCVGLLSSNFILERLSSEDLLRFLNTCITGELLPVCVPPTGCYIDVMLGNRPVVGGYSPKVGQKQIQIISILGYLNDETVPGMLEELGTYPLVYRWSNRFIPMSEATAEREIKRYERNWNNKIKGLLGMVKESFTGNPSKQVNHDAVAMSSETQVALTANTQRTTCFGYWTSELVLMHEDKEILQPAIKALSQYLEQTGFRCQVEDVNAMDAWLGTIPGHGSCNARRLFFTAENVAHASPLHSIWAGAALSSPSSLLSKNSPPVFYAATTGKTPFRFHLDVADVGHQMVLGPTGAGKSTYLGFLIAQFLRYEQAQVFVFDKDYSHFALTHALSGHHYDIGNSDIDKNNLGFCPLADLSTETKKVRAEQFIENLVLLQGVKITPEIRNAIHIAIQSLSADIHASSRNLTVFRAEVQHEEIRAALKYYTIDGQIKLLDATHDALRTGHLQTFEMNWLLAQKPEIYLPVLMYLFDQIESRLEISQDENTYKNKDKHPALRPTLIILEEAWLYIAHDVFAKKLKDWLKTLRKKNARVVFATQSLADLYDPGTKTLTRMTASLMESCPTKIYLPNPKMESEIKALYKKMGLNDRQLELIEQIGLPKRDYYVVTPEGNRLIDLGFNHNNTKSLALEFIGLSKAKSQQLIQCKQTHGDEWVCEWLKENDFNAWAEYWSANFNKFE